MNGIWHVEEELLGARRRDESRSFLKVGRDGLLGGARVSPYWTPNIPLTQHGNYITTVCRADLLFELQGVSMRMSIKARDLKKRYPLIQAQIEAQRTPRSGTLSGDALALL